MYLHIYARPVDYFFDPFAIILASGLNSHTPMVLLELLEIIIWFGIKIKDINSSSGRVSKVNLEGNN